MDPVRLNWPMIAIPQSSTRCHDAIADAESTTT
jgi:hypothetical protein